MTTYDGKKVFITGGSAGIGRAAAGYALSIWLHMWLNSAYALIRP